MNVSNWRLSALGAAMFAAALHLATGATAQVISGLSPGRYLHTCTPLADGSVLVLGGLSEQGGQVTTLDEALIFTPAPID